ncbi:sensor histidine kinase [Desulfotalea psychrophila]|nr:PAS domain-containing sensor histidine kinase [Desulfotalea psychrophila]
MTFIKKITPKLLSSQAREEAGGRDYRRLRQLLFFTMLLIAWGPALLISLLSYQNYVSLLQTEEQAQIKWRLDGSVGSLTAMIDNVKSVVYFISINDTFQDLTEDGNIDSLLALIKQQYNFIADIGVIDDTGIQQAYSGPYGLYGEDYSREDWLEIVTKKGLYISQVYLGHRKVPHFAIAVSSYDPIRQKLWILRATINATSLEKIVQTIKTKASEDLFLIDDNNIIQTASTIFGPPLSKYDPDILHPSNKNNSATHAHSLYAIGKIINSPWSLVLIEKKYLAHKQWTSFCTRLFLILSACLLTSTAVVYAIACALKDLIRKTDDIQIALLQEAEHTDKLASIGRLAAGVGHEINNPLAIVNQKNGLAEDLLSLSPDFEHRAAISKCLKSIDQNIERCKTITHRLLGFARRGEVELREVQINDIIRDVLSFLENSIMYSKINLVLRLEGGLPDVYGNNVQLQQVFLNIINNAIDATPDDGNITITTHLLAEEVQIIIQDTGEGISKEYLPHIFEPFFTTKETGKGTGLGLSITYGLVKKMGGDIIVQSHIGGGTAFTITIPALGKNEEN